MSEQKLIEALVASLSTSRLLAEQLGRPEIVMGLDILLAGNGLQASTGTAAPADNVQQTNGATPLPLEGAPARRGLGDLDFTAREHRGPVAPAFPNAGLGPDGFEEDGYEDDEDDEDEDEDGFDEVGDLAAQMEGLDEATVMAAAPNEIAIVVTRTDGLPIAEAHAQVVIDSIWTEITAAFATLRPNVITIDADNPSTATMLAFPTDADSARRLSMAGTGQTAFEATIPVAGAGTFAVKAVVGGITDEQAAAVLGMPTAADVAALPQVPEGQHPANAIVLAAEQATGERVEDVHVMTLTLTHEEGTELTVEHVHQILGHPITTAGLNRFGAWQEAGIEDGAQPSEKVVRIALLDGGEIDPRLLRVHEAARARALASGQPVPPMFGGVLPFEGIGPVRSAGTI